MDWSFLSENIEHCGVILNAAVNVRVLSKPGNYWSREENRTQLLDVYF